MSAGSTRKGEGPAAPPPPAARPASAATLPPSPEALGAERTTAAEAAAMADQLSLFEHWRLWWKKVGSAPGSIFCKVWPRAGRERDAVWSAAHPRYVDAVADVFGQVQAARIAAGQSVEWPFQNEEI